ncbi:MAG: hypothetical protein KGZ86_04260 [Candidatus Latescibacteria bacterium]|nr:hypothetical protein [Candidatus Latescibacterota bacterium]
MTKNKMLIVFVLFGLVFISYLCAQVDTAWVRRYNGPGNDYDYATIKSVKI